MFHGVRLDSHSILVYLNIQFSEVDQTAGATPAESLTFGATTWISGQSNVGPSSVDRFSSYDTLDALVDYYMDRDVRSYFLTSALFSAHL